jgi:hypothetical protein
LNLADYDPLIVINEKVSLVSDSYQLEIMQARKWLNSIINQTEKESKTKKERCEICNSKEDLKILENNHVAGRKHDYRQMTLCTPCHREFTERQSIWDARWDNENQPENLRLAFFYMGLQDTLLLKAQKTGRSVYADLARTLFPTIAYLLRGTQN